MKLIEDVIVLLRNDAIERGMHELAITYGWSAIRLRAERLDALTKSLGIKTAR